MEVKTLNDVFVEGSLHHKGEEFEYSGPYNRHLEPTDKADREKWKKGPLKGPKLTAGAQAPSSPVSEEKAPAGEPEGTAS